MIRQGLIESAENIVVEITDERWAYGFRFSTGDEAANAALTFDDGKFFLTPNEDDGALSISLVEEGTALISNSFNVSGGSIFLDRANKLFGFTGGNRRRRNRNSNRPDQTRHRNETEYIGRIFRDEAYVYSDEEYLVRLDASVYTFGDESYTIGGDFVDVATEKYQAGRRRRKCCLGD